MVLSQLIELSPGNSPLAELSLLRNYANIDLEEHESIKPGIQTLILGSNNIDHVSKIRSFFTNLK